MAATTTATLSNSVVASHLQTEFMVASAAQARWDQFSWVPANGAIPPAESETATTIGVIVYNNLDLITTAIAEATDIEGVQAGDNTINVAVSEYGNALQDTKRLRALSRTDIPVVFQELIGRNAGLSQDNLARTSYLGGSLSRRPTASNTRAQLDTANDDLQQAGFNFFYSLVAQLRSAGSPGIGQASEAVGRQQGASEPGTVDYGTVVHDLVTGDLLETNGFTPIQYITAPDARQQMFNGEFGRLAGVRIVESPLGKIYQSAGTIAQTATSLSVAAAAGATSIVVASATGITTGDYLSVGALETGTTDTAILESVLVHSIQSTTTMHVNASGPAGGLRFAHAADAAVTEGTFVGAIPVFGGMSVAKVFSTIAGPKPTMTRTGPFDKLGRFENYGWWWLGGYGRTLPTWLIRGEVAVNGKAVMNNFV